MATVYLMNNGVAQVTFSGGAENNGDRITWSVGSNTTGSASYKCTYNCPSGSKVYGSGKRTGSGTVYDASFVVGSNSYTISDSFSKFYSASGSTSIGYSFYCNGWKSGGASVQIWGSTIYVSYSSTYTITVLAGTGISSVSGGGTVTEGSSKTINATVSAGYTWYRWQYTSGGSAYSTSQSVSVKPTSNISLTAVATPNTYYIKYNANGGTGSMSNTTCSYGTYYTLRANTFTKDKYIFAGWATSASGAKIYDDQQQVRNLTTTNGGTYNLYAVWEKDPNAVFVNTTKVYNNGWK